MSDFKKQCKKLILLEETRSLVPEDQRAEFDLTYDMNVDSALLYETYKRFLKLYDGPAPQRIF